MLPPDDWQDAPPVRFDDRLTTVLAQPAEDAHDRAVRWRQLVELLARARGQLESEVAQQALVEVQDEAPAVDEPLRAAAARAIAGLKLPIELVRVFAADRLVVAAPILAAANLEDDDWAALHAGASKEIAGFIASLHPQVIGTTDKPPATAPADTSPVAAAPLRLAPSVAGEDDRAIPSISELVTRIERLRRGREAAKTVAPPSSPEILDPGSAAMFRWEAGPSGEIGWIQGAPRGAIIGRSLANAADEGFDERVERAFALRAPFRDAPFRIARSGPLAGEWRISGMPAFQPADGRFAGYRGVAVRKPAAALEPAAPSTPPDHDAVRELVHEIKTPLNAIIGFAEIIEQQYLGPADHRYRTRAGEIVGHARVLLEAIDDLDFAAKLQSGRGDPGVASDLGTLLGALYDELQDHARLRGASVVLQLGQGQECRTNAALAQRLIRRLAVALAQSLSAGERLVLSTMQRGGQCRVTAERPQLFAGRDVDALLRSGEAGETGTVETAAFWLRLVRGLARIAGGDLVVDASHFTLVLPEAAA